MAKLEPEKAIEYGEREQLDSELATAIADILSAEQEAKHIIAQAEASVKAVQLDGATRERDMREQSNKITAAARDDAISNALAKASEERIKRVEQAERDGEQLIKAKSDAVRARVDELYATLIGGTPKANKADIAVADKPKKTGKPKNEKATESKPKSEKKSK